jgi:hypothetical protein
MKRIITLITVIAGLALAGSAQASGSHYCSSAAPVIASSTTSCPFAWNIVSAYFNGDCWQYRSCIGYVRSPVTRRSYHITCTTGSRWAYCTADPEWKTKAWVKFPN